MPCPMKGVGWSGHPRIMEHWGEGSLLPTLRLEYVAPMQKRARAEMGPGAGVLTLQDQTYPALARREAAPFREFEMGSLAQEAGCYRRACGTGAEDKGWGASPHHANTPS